MNYYERTTEEQKIIDACIVFELSENNNGCKNPYIEIIKAMPEGKELLNSIKNYIENL